ncbi:hypothetical protein [Streptomyces sp. NPDC008317]|uniref:hypothetical protein n=1 Tax=Streptomyces sp. NPDC008317 TaxID=3364827 RepID=UPI0036E88D58
MSNPFLERRRRRALPLVLLCVAGALAFVAVGVGVVSQLGPHGPKTYAPPKPKYPPGVSSSSPSPKAVPTSSKAALTGALQLVQGRHLVNGVSLGYPHSTVGAVSAAAEYMRQIGSTLSPDRAAAVGRLVADPSWPDAPRQFAKGPTGTRKSVGISTSGQVPTGASVVLAPVEYQVPTAEADTAKVLLLATYTTTSPGQGTQTRMGVYPVDLHWSAGDWKVLAPADSTDYSGLSAEPDSPTASAKGWQELKR